MVKIPARRYTRVYRRRKEVRIEDRFFNSPVGLRIEIILQETIHRFVVFTEVELIQQHNIRSHGAENSGNLLSLFIGSTGKIAEQFPGLVAIETAIKRGNSHGLL